MTCSYCKKNPAVRKAAAGKMVICGPCRLARLVKLRGQGNASEGIRKLLNVGKPTTNNQNAVKGDQEESE